MELKPGASVTAEELIAHCKSLLAGCKVPREIRFEAHPKTSTGKIQKFQLRERARALPPSNEERVMTTTNPWCCARPTRAAW